MAATAACSTLPVVLHKKEPPLFTARRAVTRDDVRSFWTAFSPRVGKEGPGSLRRTSLIAPLLASSLREVRLAPVSESRVEVTLAPPRSCKVANRSRWRGARDRSGRAAARITAH